MIYLNEAQIDGYIGMDARLDQAFKMIREGSAKSLAPGRYDANDGMYFLCQSYVPKALDDTVWETHERFIDVQYAVSGSERMGVIPDTTGLALKSFDKEKDFALYAGPDENLMRLRQGDIMVFFPGEAHRPCVKLEGGEIRKIVFKVPV